MTRIIELELASAVSADRSSVLESVASLAGVNEELRPILRMTAPKAFRDRSLFDWPVGRPLFRSWLLLGGVLPIDFDHIALVSTDPEQGFLECSVMLTMARWRHERRVFEREPSGSRIVDRLAFSARIPGTGWLLKKLVLRVFQHRHARLRQRFGAAR